MELFALVFGIIAKDFVCVWFFLLCFIFFSWKRFTQNLSLFLCGFALMSFHEVLFPPLTSHADSVNHHFIGKILSFEQNKSDVTKCLVEVLEMDDQQKHFKIGLYFTKKHQHLYPGEVWTWYGRLKPYREFFNPGTETIWYKPHFRHIEANVFVTADLKPYRKLSRFDLLNRVRIQIYQAAYRHIQDSFTRSLFLTLILGIGSELDSESWQLFKVTGTVHLMVISGAHLSLMMGLCSKLFEMLRFLFPRLLISYPLKQITSLLSLGIGFVYALISGFGIPVQRAWLMSFMGWYHYFGRRRIDSWQAFRWSLYVVLIIEPHAVWYPGTYLSYLAVAILIACNQLDIKSAWYQKCLTQLACLFGLGPLTLLWFGNFPILGLVSNMLAIPWVSWILLPLAFLLALMFLTYVFNSVIVIFGYSATWFQKGLSYFANFNDINVIAHWPHPAHPWVLLLSLILWFIYPRLTLLVSVVLINVLFWFPHPRVFHSGDFSVDMIDVGQGLAVLVNTKKHHLLFDTGGMLGKRPIALQTILPFLKYKGVEKLDKLIISHPDLDHRGGLESIRSQVMVNELLADNPHLYQEAQSCHRMSDWCWGSICFHFVKYHVPHASKNNHSCVLKVFNSHFQVLLTGDIEKEAEYAMLRQESRGLGATVLFIPHHGSQTSSSYWLLEQVKPKIALLSVAQFNPYHLPHPKIMDRYHYWHIPVLSTSTLGMISVFFTRQQFNLIKWRQKEGMQYWLNI